MCQKCRSQSPAFQQPHQSSNPSKQQPAFRSYALSNLDRWNQVRVRSAAPGFIFLDKCDSLHVNGLNASSSQIGATCVSWRLSGRFECCEVPFFMVYTHCTTIAVCCVTPRKSNLIVYADLPSHICLINDHNLY